MAAIPTTYRGVRFRSRLEARWAAFFDLMQWRWEYEPIDLRGYIPDFIVRLHKPVLVEVKPVLWDGSETETAVLAEAMGKLELSGWDREALIVGASLALAGTWIGGWSTDAPSLGLLAERRWLTDLGRPITDETDDESWCWARSFAFRCASCGRDSFSHDLGTWSCRVSGCYDGDGHLDVGNDDVAAAWLTAGNAVQWRGGVR